MKPVRRAARAMLGAVFITNGVRAMTNPDPLIPQAKPVGDRIGTALAKLYPRLTPDTRQLVRLNGALQFAGGLLLATNHATRPAAATLAGSLLPTTIAGHPFWTVKDPAERQAQRVQFEKNVALIGGLLLATVDTEGRPGLRWRAGRMARDTRHLAKHVRRAARTAQRDARIAAKSATIGRITAR